MTRDRPASGASDNTQDGQFPSDMGTKREPERGLKWPSKTKITQPETPSDTGAMVWYHRNLGGYSAKQNLFGHSITTISKYSTDQYTSTGSAQFSITYDKSGMGYFRGSLTVSETTNTGFTNDVKLKFDVSGVGSKVFNTPSWIYGHFTYATTNGYKSHTTLINYPNMPYTHTIPSDTLATGAWISAFIYPNYFYYPTKKQARFYSTAGSTFTTSGFNFYRFINTGFKLNASVTTGGSVVSNNITGTWFAHTLSLSRLNTTDLSYSYER